MKHLIFVYGTLKRRGGAWGYFLGQSEFVGEAVTINKFRVLDGGFPVALQSEAIAPLRGEVFEVDDETVERLDGYEGVDSGMFVRTYQEVQIDNGERRTVQMYFGGDDYWIDKAARPTAPLNQHGHFEWLPHSVRQCD